MFSYTFNVFLKHFLKCYNTQGFDMQIAYFWKENYVVFIGFFNGN